MRRILHATAFAILAIVISTSAQAAKKLTDDELRAYLEKKDAKVFFLDVREPREIEQNGSVPGYVNIPIGQLESRLSEVPKDKLIITMCQRGGRAGRAADLLEKNGYTVAGSCGLADTKASLVYPKDKEKAKQ